MEGPGLPGVPGDHARPGAASGAPSSGEARKLGGWGVRRNGSSGHLLPLLNEVAPAKLDKPHLWAHQRGHHRICLREVTLEPL